jgi:hypothetical protein
MGCLMLPTGGSTVVEHSTNNPKVKGSNPVDTERKLLAPGDRIMVQKSQASCNVFKVF